jgi:pimeloyl-ACP methyl ester carboxylesterase
MALSEAVVKKELDQVYQVLQVTSAAALARRLVEANALHWLTRATRGDVGYVDAGAEPLQFAHRADGSRIAVSDYGPASGRPVLVLHSALTTRPVSRGLIRELHRAGYRPISIDRPGFGMSDELRASDAGHYDPHAAAAVDTVTVLDKLKVRRADVVARGAARSVLALHALAPERLGRVVLVNPGLHAVEDKRNSGLFGLLKQAYRRNPVMIRAFVTALARQLTYDRHKGLMLRWMRGSPPDEAAIEDATIVRDYFHAQRMFVTGRLGGYVAEQTEYLRGSRPAVVRGTLDWRVLLGAHDTLHEPGDVLACWRDVLPDAGFRVLDDAGRLLAMSHPHYVVEALQAPS